MLPKSLSVTDVITAQGEGAFYYEDQEAIRAGAVKDGEFYLGEPVLAGFTAIRVPAATLSVGLRLCDGYVAWGDMVSVQYPGTGGRSKPFDPSKAGELIKSVLKPALVGQQLGSFADENRRWMGHLRSNGIDHPAFDYGLSQAILDATAHSRRVSIAEAIVNEFGLPLELKRTPVYAQSGDNRESNTDKMILKRVEFLPHGLINGPDKFGDDGAAFLHFVEWTSNRVRSMAADDYHPTLYFDVYGMPGKIIGLDCNKLGEFFTSVAARARPFSVCIENPADFGDRDLQLVEYGNLRKWLAERKVEAMIAVDEWCNTLEDIKLFAEGRSADFIHIKLPDLGSVMNSIDAVRTCHDNGVRALLGGSCTETDVSARISANIALAMQADAMLAKPGMGVDEGISIVRNEQARILALAQARGHS